MTVFTEITLLVVVATLVAFLMRLLRQPLVIGYIATGLICGPLFLNIVKSEETINLFSEIGISLLLFIVGINLTPEAIKKFGKVSLITGIGQVLFTASIGFIISRILGFNAVTSIYLAIALAFSSTIIILKLLSDKGDIEKLYGKISIGFLLVQDFIAVIILFLLPPLAANNNSPLILTSKFVLGLSFLVIAYLVAHSLLPRLNRYIATSQELLFLFAIAWGLGIATLFRALGFSLESGALIAGATLATLPSRDEIHSRLKPLRDFFIILFFVLLGAKMVLAGSSGLLLPAAILSVFVLIGNPIILMIIMGLLGYRKKTSFQTGLTVAQISEFSLIVVALGVKLGHVSDSTLALTTIVGIVTIFGSTYMVMNSDRLYNLLAPLLTIFERKSINETKVQNTQWKYVLFGQNRIGYDFANLFEKSKQPFLIVDYDPSVVQRVQSQNRAVMYGDVSDVEYLDSLDLDRVQAVVSTIPDKKTNELILSVVRARSQDSIILLTAYTIPESLELYDKGADYVILPHLLGGQHASTLLSKSKDRASFRTIRASHKKYLQGRIAPTLT